MNDANIMLKDDVNRFVPGILSNCREFRNVSHEKKKKWKWQRRERKRVWNVIIAIEYGNNLARSFFRYQHQSYDIHEHKHLYIRINVVQLWLAARFHGKMFNQNHIDCATLSYFAFGLDCSTIFFSLKWSNCCIRNLNLSSLPTKWILNEIMIDGKAFPPIPMTFPSR